VAGEGCDVYAYFNNDYEGNAVSDARWLRSRLEGDVSSSFRFRRLINAHLGSRTRMG